MEAITFAIGLTLRLALPATMLFMMSHYLRTWDAHRAV
jgi:hypothetical protein